MAAIGVIGVGSIGSVLARGFDGLGHDVCVNDTDAAAAAEVPLPSVSKADMAERCQLVVLAVPTPTTEDGGDVRHVREALRGLGDTHATVCIRSTMPPGETRQLADAVDHDLVYSPEFLRDRSGVEAFFDPDRVVLAGPEAGRAVVKTALGEVAAGVPVLEYDRYLPAELGKEAHNAHFAAQVSFANQVRAIAEAAGANPRAVMDVVVADSRRTGSHLDPMLGPYGGKCLPKDTEALRHYARERGVETALLDGVIGQNAIAREEYADRELEGDWPDVRVVGEEVVADGGEPEGSA